MHTWRQSRKGIASLALAVAVALGIAGTGANLPGADRTGDAPAHALAASPAASPVPGVGVPSTQIIVGEITIGITDSGFQPGYFESAVDRDITITLVNSDTAPHNFSIEKLDISVDIESGTTARVQIDNPRLGHYEFFSNLPGDDHLVGSFSVFI